MASSLSVAFTVCSTCSFDTPSIVVGISLGSEVGTGRREVTMTDSSIESNEVSATTTVGMPISADNGRTVKPIERNFIEHLHKPEVGTAIPFDCVCDRQTGMR